ncbi:hypothetical protein SBA3_1390033 [Candidatus Sulfopaludibacter sp. SbA3]|nr:hypothetical protein SBA3_1390033 [Candidatus Sulfopaludibacter sp. SbA3]
MRHLSHITSDKCRMSRPDPLTREHDIIPGIPMRAFTAAVVILIPRLACGVTPIRAGALIEYKANSFDLDGKRLRFAPEGTKGYSVRTDASDGLLERGAEVRVPPGASGRLGSRPIQLACPFPFAGKNWNEVHLNTTGNLTFGAPETELYPERDTWPGGTMRFVAAAIDSRSGSDRQPIASWARTHDRAAVGPVFVRCQQDLRQLVCP